MLLGGRCIALIIICIDARCTSSAGDIFGILYLARESLLKHMCCYFLLFLGWLLASLLHVFMCVYIDQKL